MKIGSLCTVDVLALKSDSETVRELAGEHLKRNMADKLFEIVKPEKLYSISTRIKEIEQPHNFTHEFRMTADVNEIVKCKYCEFTEKPIEITAHKFPLYCINLQRFVDDEWFCADGERKTE